MFLILAKLGPQNLFQSLPACFTVKAAPVDSRSEAMAPPTVNSMAMTTIKGKIILF